MEGGAVMSVSVVLQLIPEDVGEARAYIESFKGIEGVKECILSLPNLLNGPALSGLFETADALADSFFRFEVCPSDFSSSACMNNSAVKSRGDVLLFVERGFTVVRDSETMLSLDELQRGVVAEISRFRSLDSQVNEVLGQPEYLTRLPDTSLGRVFAIDRAHFLEVRGFDENASFCEALGYDFILRQRRRGGKVASVRGVKAVAKEQSISVPTEDEIRLMERVDNRQSLYPNLIDWSVPQDERLPLVSVAIATKDRYEMLVESINSVLYQTFQEFEIIVVDDGSEDPLRVEQVIASIDDARIKLIHHDRSRGVAAARNTAATHSSCLLTAVHDDDDIMLPNRLEIGIDGLSQTVDATYGGWINFQDDTGELRGFLTLKGFSAAMVAFNGAGPGHSTWTLPTQLIRDFSYDERLTSSVDHELATRLMNAGVNWGHVERFMYLRRVHDLQITAQDSDNQKAGHTLSRLANRFLTSGPSQSSLKKKGEELKYPDVPGRTDLFNSFGAYLPDKLVSRDIILQGNTVNLAIDADMPDKLTTIVAERDILRDRAVFETAVIEDVSQDDIVNLRRIGFRSFKLRVRDQIEFHADASTEEAQEAPIPPQTRVDESLQQRLLESSKMLRKHDGTVQLSVLYFPKSVEVVSIEAFEGLLQEARKIVSVGEFGYKSSAYIFVTKDHYTAQELETYLRAAYPRNSTYRIGVSSATFAKEFPNTNEKEISVELNDSGIDRGL